MAENPADDLLTLVALGAAAFVLAGVSHEALGHGLAILAVGATPVVLTTCYFSSSGSLSPWIPAAGGLANVAAGLLALGALRILRAASPHLRWFLILAAAFNLFFAAAYPAYSGIALFGDWAAVISGCSPEWFWRILLIASSVAFYFLFLKLIAAAIQPFLGSSDAQALNRLRRITLIPYLAAMAAAALAGALNPMGWLTMFTAGLPAAAASFGLTQMDHFQPVRPPDAATPPAGHIKRSYPWIAAGAIVLALYVGVLGPGIRFAQQ